MKQLTRILIFACALSAPVFSQTPVSCPAGTQTNCWNIMPVAVPLFALAAPGAPTSHAPIAGGSCDAGTHKWAVTFISAIGETTIGTGSTVQTCGASATEALTAIPLGPAGTTGRNVYRSKAGTSTPFDLDCASAPCIADNTTTTFTDTLADASLGAASPSNNGTGTYPVLSTDAYLKTLTVSNNTGGSLTFTLADQQVSPVAVLETVVIAANTTQVFSWPGYYWCPGGFTVQASATGLTFYVGWLQP